MTEIVRFTDRPSVPWANGGGTTRVLVDDAHPGGGEWTWRVSVAELAGAQPFSRFAGVDRHLTFLGPGELEITIDGVASTLTPLEEIRFRGEDDVASDPSAPSARDLNVMTRRGACLSDATRTERPASLMPSADASAALWISLLPGGRIDGVSVAQRDVALLRLDAPARTEGTGLFVEIRSAASQR